MEEIEEMAGIEDLSPSALGTRQYWDSVYEGECENFLEHGDEGEIWFGKQCEGRMVEWICKRFDRTSQIVEIGCGNGHLLTMLARRGYERLVGLDYSEGGIHLAQKVASTAGFPDIRFIVNDLMQLSQSNGHDLHASLIVDKGTFDAISLGPDPEEQNERKNAPSRIHNICKRFKRSLLQIFDRQVKDASCHFLITSCNWTRTELESLFSPELTVVDEIANPSFSFGGQKGQTITTLAFQLDPNAVHLQ